MTSRKDDPRFFVGLEVGWGILKANYGKGDGDCTEEIELRRKELTPDIWAHDKSVCVVLGVLREDSLHEFLKHFDEVVHLPYPASFGGDLNEPTAFRAFKRSKAKPVQDKRVVVWGDGLIHGRSLRERKK